MEANFGVAGNERKPLVREAADILGAGFSYMGMPSGSYEVGDYILDTSGVLSPKDDVAVTSDEFISLIDQLREKGYQPITVTVEDATDGAANGGEADAIISEDEAEPEEAEPGDVESEEAEPEKIESEKTKSEEAGSEETEDLLTIEVPRAEFSVTALDNLKKIIKSKYTLFKMALGVDDLPLVITEDIIGFPWFRPIDSEHSGVYARFVETLCRRAKTASFITGVESPFDDARTALRIFLVRMGYTGTDYALDRRILSENLPKSSAVRHEAKAVSLNDTIKEQIAALRVSGKVNMYDDAAVQNAAHEAVMPELVRYMEGLRHSPRTEYINHLLCESRECEVKVHEQ